MWLICCNRRVPKNRQQIFYMCQNTPQNPQGGCFLQEKLKQGFFKKKLSQQNLSANWHRKGKEQILYIRAAKVSVILAPVDSQLSNSKLMTKLANGTLAGTLSRQSSSLNGAGGHRAGACSQKTWDVPAPWIHCVASHHAEKASTGTEYRKPRNQAHVRNLNVDVVWNYRLFCCGLESILCALHTKTEKIPSLSSIRFFFSVALRPQKPSGLS